MTDQELKDKVKALLEEYGCHEVKHIKLFLHETVDDNGNPAVNIQMPIWARKPKPQE